MYIYICVLVKNLNYNGVTAYDVITVDSGGNLLCAGDPVFDNSHRAFAIDLLSSGVPVVGGNFANNFASFYVPISGIPAPTIIAPLSGSYTNSTSIMAGTGQSGAIFVVSDDVGTVLATGTVSSTGYWSVLLSSLPDGTYVRTVFLDDGLGNVSPSVATTFFVATTQILPDNANYPVIAGYPGFPSGITNVTQAFYVSGAAGVQSGNVTIDPSSTAVYSNFLCTQVSPTLVHCTLDITGGEYLNISAVDNLGNTITSSNDIMPPVIQVAVDILAPADENHPHFVLDMTDNVWADYCEFQYYADNGGPGISGLTYDSLWLFPWDFDFATYGIALDPDELLTGDMVHTVGFRCVDVNGNITTQIAKFPPTINFTGPVISNQNPIPAQITITSPNDSPIDAITLITGTTIPTATIGTCIGSGGDMTEPYNSPAVCSINGVTTNGTIIVQARDSVIGAIGQNAQAYIIDVLPPSVTIAAPTLLSGSSIRNTTITITDNINVTTGGIAINTGTTAPYSAFSCVSSLGVITCSISINNDGNLSVTVIDAAGNITIATNTGYVVDTIPPVIAFVDNISSGSVQSESFTFTGSDDVGLNTGSFIYGFSTDAVCDATDVYTIAATGGVIATEANNGKYLCARVDDVAGNASYVVSAHPILVDITAPVVTLSGLSNVTLAQGGVYTEAGATWTDNVDGGGFVAAPFSGNVNVSVPGTYVLEYTYTDNAGNTGNVVMRTVTVSAPLDVIPPTANLTTASTGVTGGFIVTITPTESVVGLTLADIEITNGYASDFNGTGVGPYTVLITPHNPGAITVQVGTSSVADQVGNMNVVPSNVLSINYNGTVYTRNFCPTSLRATEGAAGSYVTNLSDIQVTDGVYSIGDAAYAPAGLPDEASAFGYSFSMMPSVATVTKVVWNTEWKINEAFVAGDREILFIRTGNYNVNIPAATLEPAGSPELINLFSTTDPIVVGQLRSSSLTMATVPSRSQLSTYYAVAYNDGRLGFDSVCALVSITLPVPLTPDMTSGTDGGSSSIDNLTNDTTPTFTGSCTSGDVVSLYVDGTGSAVGAQTCTSSGAYEITISAQPIGAHTIAATFTPSGFPETVQGPSLAFIIDTVAPLVPVITTPLSGAALATGTVNIMGTGEPGALITVMLGGTALTGLVDGSGNRSQVFVGVLEGVYSLSATQVDLAGNASTTAIQPLTIDLTSPTVTLSGSASMTVAQGGVYTEGGALYTDNTDGTGIILMPYSGSVNVGVAGVYTLYYRYVDRAGNTGNIVTRTVTVVVPTSEGGGGGSYGGGGGGSSYVPPVTPTTPVIPVPTQPTPSTLPVGPTLTPADTDTFNATITDDLCFKRKSVVLTGTSTQVVHKDFPAALRFLASYELTKYNAIDVYRPFDLVTRQEAAKLFTQYARQVLCRQPNNETIAYVDVVNADASLKPFITLSYQLGLMHGDAKKTFRPMDTITKQEFLAVLVRTMLNSYLDESSSQRYASYEKAAKDLTIITQDIDPKNTGVTRHDAALMIFRAYKYQTYGLFNEGYDTYIVDTYQKIIKKYK